MGEQIMDKRKFSRVNVSMAAAIKTDDFFILCNIGDLSLQGLFIKSHLKIHDNEPVNVMIYGPNRTFFLRATAVHNNDAGTGFMIHEIGQPALTELKKIIASKLDDAMDSFNTSATIH